MIEKPALLVEWITTAVINYCVKKRVTLFSL